MRTQILVNKWAPRTVADPDLQIRGGGGDGGGHPVPEIRGGEAGLKKFFRPLRPQLGVGEGVGTPGPSPGSATADQGFWRCFVDTINKS